NAPLFGLFSTDGGPTWNLSDTSSVSRTCCDAQSTWDSFGNLFVTYLNPANSAIVTILSTDGGQSFTPLLSSPGSVDQPSIAVGPDGTGAGSVWISYYTSSGIRVQGAQVTGLGAVGDFTAPLAVPGSATGNFGSIAVGTGGEVLVNYQIPSNDRGPSIVYANLKADGLGPGGFEPRLRVT